MCLAETRYTSTDDYLSAPCPDPNNISEVCVYHTKMRDGLVEPNFPEYAKDAVVMAGEVQVWPRTL